MKLSLKIQKNLDISNKKEKKEKIFSQLLSVWNITNKVNQVFLKFFYFFKNKKNKAIIQQHQEKQLNTALEEEINVITQRRGSLGNANLSRESNYRQIADKYFKSK